MKTTVLSKKAIKEKRMIAATDKVPKIPSKIIPASVPGIPYRTLDVISFFVLLLSDLIMSGMKKGNTAKKRINTPGFPDTSAMKKYKSERFTRSFCVFCVLFSF